MFVNIVTREDSQTSGIPSLERISAKLSGLEKIVEIANLSDISDDSYGYVLSLWFNINIFNISLNCSHESCIILAKRIFEIYNKIQRKDVFFKFLNTFSPKICEILREQNTYALYSFPFILKIQNQNLLIDKYKKLSLYFEDCLLSSYKSVSINSDDFVYIITVNTNYELYNNYVRENKFISKLQNVNYVDIDNRLDNKFISVRYNEFLNSYDYLKESWFIFCHSDWEIVDDVNNLLKKLDKNYIYGPIGAKLDIINGKYISYLVGSCFEKKRDNTETKCYYNPDNSSGVVDTLDCQAMIVHSSLIKKYNLRFDEKLKFDLYVEDFCLNAKIKHNIQTKVIKFTSCHHSDSGFGIVPNSYINQLQYINEKYSSYLFGGTVTPIGGAKFSKMSEKEYLMYKIRKNLLSKHKNKEIK